jgi:hypothetical protein
MNHFLKESLSIIIIIIIIIMLLFCCCCWCCWRWRRRWLTFLLGHYYFLTTVVRSWFFKHVNYARQQISIGSTPERGKTRSHFYSVQTGSPCSPLINGYWKCFRRSKLAERECGHCPLPGAEVKNSGAKPLFSHTSSWHVQGKTTVPLVLTTLTVWKVKYVE